MANLFRKICSILYQNLPHFAKDITKTFWCFFSVHSSNCCSLANANAKFHKVRYSHYLGEAENVYISVRQIYSGQFYHNRSGFVDCMSKNMLVWCFSVQSVVTWRTMEAPVMGLGLYIPKRRLPPPPWNLVVKNQEVNCAKSSNFDRFCSQNL